MVKSIGEVGVEELVEAGLSVEEASELERLIKDATNSKWWFEPTELWREVVARRLLKPWHPHAVHQRPSSLLVSFSVNESKHTNLGRLMEKHGSELLGPLYNDPITSFSLFHKFSVQHPELSISFREAPECILDRTNKSKRGRSWLPGAVLTIVECCLLSTTHPRKKDDNPAIVWRDEGYDDSDVNIMTLKEVREQVMLVANVLDVMFSKGDAIAIDMQMTVIAVIIYLAIILSGRVAVSIADSFATKEIATRLRISNAKAIFTQDFILRGGRKFPLYSQVAEAAPDKAIVLSAIGGRVDIQLRE